MNVAKKEETFSRLRKRNGTAGGIRKLSHSKQLVGGGSTRKGGRETESPDISQKKKKKGKKEKGGRYRWSRAVS